jgi:hypothetical protein
MTRLPAFLFALVMLPEAAQVIDTTFAVSANFNPNQLHYF